MGYDYSIDSPHSPRLFEGESPLALPGTRRNSSSRYQGGTCSRRPCERVSTRTSHHGHHMRTTAL